MFARGTWGELPTDKVNDLATALRPSIDAISACAGYAGVVALANRESGAVVVVTYWETEEEMQGSEQVAAGTRADVTARLPGMKVVDVDRMEIMLRERVATPRNNTAVRHTDLRIPPEKLDTLVGTLRDRWLPQAKQQHGFRACLVSINRANGHAVAASIWDSVADLDAAETALASVREEVRASIGPHSPPTVQRFESVLTEIKLPTPA